MASKMTLPKFQIEVGLAQPLVVFLVLTAIAAYMNNREERNNVRYVGLSSQLLMLSQRLAKDAQQTLTGSPAAFAALTESKTSLSNILAKLDKGDGTLPATTGEARAALDDLMKISGKTLQDVQVLEAGRAGLVTLANTVAAINTVSAEFRGLTQSMMEDYRGAQREQAARFALATERIGKDASMAMGMDVTIEQVARLGIDTLAAEESLAALPAGDANVARAGACSITTAIAFRYWFPRCAIWWLPRKQPGRSSRIPVLC